MYIDLTHPISNGMPHYPGTPPPEVSPLCTIEEVGFAEMNLKIFSHTGTHIDAPAHMLRDGKTLDAYDIGYFTGRALIIDADKRTIFDLDYVRDCFERVAVAPDFVLLHTGWDRLWLDSHYYEGFPVLSLAAAEYIANKGVRGVGVDAISVDRVEDETLPVHQILFAKEMIIIENLTNLHHIKELCPIRESLVDFAAIPIKVENSDGSPARAFANHR